MLKVTEEIYFIFRKISQKYAKGINVSLIKASALLNLQLLV